VPYKDPEKQREHNRAYRQAHREEALAYAKRYREAHPEKMAAYKRKWVKKIGRTALTTNRREYHRERYQSNREVMRARQNEYRRQYPERHYERQLKRRLGMTLAEKRIVWEAQDKKCKLCNRPITLLGAHVDHIHDRKPIVIRGLLCGSCNRAIGLFRDDPEVLDRAAAYLRDFSIII
jgi:hypothetical protein